MPHLCCCLPPQADLEQGLAALLSEAGATSVGELLPHPGPDTPHPRTARVNTLRMSVDAALAWLRTPPEKHRRRWAAVVSEC